jgi:CRISPR-associated protein Csm5
MEENFLKQYILFTQTLGPIHIGTGVKLGNADFVFSDGEVVVIDEHKLSAWIAKQPNADRLVSALTTDLMRQDGGIAKFLRENYRGPIDAIEAYRLPYQGKPKDVGTFIKTFDHKPYLPGSSLKGVLRSGLLRGKMLGDDDLKSQAVEAIDEGVNRRGRPSTQSDKIQANVFVKNTTDPARWSNFDINRLMLIRDSTNLSVDNLEVVGVRTLSVDTRGGLHPEEYDIYVECLRTKTLIENGISWQTNLLFSQAKTLGFEKLEELMVFLPNYCRRVSVDLLTQERDFYERHRESDLVEWFEGRLRSLQKSEEGVFILPMGWGSGYDAKTITDLLGVEVLKDVVDTFDNTSGLGYPGNRRGPVWLGTQGDAPKSRKIVVRSNGKPHPVGWVAMRFVPVDKQDDWLTARRTALASQKPAILEDTGDL